MQNVVRHVPIRTVNEERVDKYELADKCPHWKLNEGSCNRIIFEYNQDDIFVWKPVINDQTD